mmetsp:Transcript_51214/g.161092  ORF Transcript_51214/g.161092 Transcript_51214/m.161092 type:complete len:274 (-) Transcript_51214:559-1380(-)
MLRDRGQRELAVRADPRAGARARAARARRILGRKEVPDCPHVLVHSREDCVVHDVRGDNSATPTEALPHHCRYRLVGDIHDVVVDLDVDRVWVPADRVDLGEAPASHRRHVVVRSMRLDEFLEEEQVVRHGGKHDEGDAVQEPAVDPEVAQQVAVQHPDPVAPAEDDDGLDPLLLQAPRQGQPVGAGAGGLQGVVGPPRRGGRWARRCGEWAGCGAMRASDLAKEGGLLNLGEEPPERPLRREEAQERKALAPPGLARPLPALQELQHLLPRR